MNYRSWAILAIASALLAQDATQKKEAAEPPKKAEPAPLFGGKLGIRSSESKKESATLGFNGIDPSGKVDAQMLATTPGAADRAKVQQLAAARPKPAELAAFLKEGGLKKK
jgi:hypothetical protein